MLRLEASVYHFAFLSLLPFNLILRSNIFHGSPDILSYHSRLIDTFSQKVQLDFIMHAHKREVAVFGCFSPAFQFVRWVHIGSRNMKPGTVMSLILMSKPIHYTSAMAMTGSTTNCFVITKIQVL